MEEMKGGGGVWQLREMWVGAQPPQRGVGEGGQPLAAGAGASATNN